MKNVFTLLQERSHRGQQAPFFNSAVLIARAARGEHNALLRLKAIQGDKEAISQVVKEAKESEETAIDVLTSELQRKLHGFEISDIGNQQKSTIDLIIHQPTLFQKLAPNDITKLALNDEALALKAVRGEIRASLPGDPTQNHNLNNINIAALAKKFVSVISVVLNTATLLSKLKDPQLTHLRNIYQNDTEICTRLNDEINRRAQLPPPAKRRCLAF